MYTNSTFFSGRYHLVVGLMCDALFTYSSLPPPNELGSGMHSANSATGI